MKKIDLGQIISFLANAGVIASIVFLGFELRQNTRAVELASAQSYLTGGSELDLRIATDTNLASLLIRGNRGNDQQPIDAAKELQLERWNYAVFRQWETASYLNSIGALDASLWLAYRQEIKKILLRSPPMQKYWRSNSGSFTPAFGREISLIISESDSK